MVTLRLMCKQCWTGKNQSRPVAVPWLAVRHGRVVKNDAPLSAIFSAIQLKEMDRIEQNNLEGLMYYDVFSNLTFLLVPYCLTTKPTRTM